MRDSNNARIGETYLISEEGDEHKAQEEGNLHMPGDGRVQKEQPAEDHEEFWGYGQTE